MINYADKKVLIIEDFTEFARSIRNMMLDLGALHIETVHDGEAAVQICKDNHFDIILSDYNLGDGKDGMQLMEELQVKKYVKKDTTIVMVTAENTKAMVMAAVEFQPDDYVTKPFNSSLLSSRLEKIITKKETLKTLFQLMEKKKYAEAVTECDRIIENNPRYKMACLHHKADCLRKEKRLNEAIGIYDFINSKRPLPWSMIGLSQVLMLQGDFKNAESALSETVKLYPMLLEGYDLLAECQKQLGQKEAAQKTLENATMRSPRNLQRQKELGELAFENEDFKLAERSYRQTIILGRNSLNRSPSHYINYIGSLTKQFELDDGKSGLNKKSMLNDVRRYLKEFKSDYAEDKTIKLRCAVAEAGLNTSLGNEEEAKRQIAKVEKGYSELSEILPPDIGIELAKGLQDLGFDDYAENILKDTVEHYYEDSEFITKALPLLKDKSVLENAKIAQKLNKEGIKLFRDKAYEQAAIQFTNAMEASPKNISIILNAVQVLLQIYKAANRDSKIIASCEDFLERIKGIGPEDSRFSRYSELLRLTRLISHQIKVKNEQ